MPRKFYKEENEPIPAIKFELSKPVGFSEITDPQEIKILYIKQYQTRILDGQDCGQNFTAELYIKVIGGTYSEQEAFELEDHTKDLYRELMSGWWLTAQNTNLNLPLFGIYDQVLKDEIQNNIDIYIQQNY